MNEIVKKRKGLRYLAWRKAVFERDGYACVSCNSTVNKLHAHHIKSFDEYPELRVDIDNGLTLCTSCHNKHHHLGSCPWNKGKKLTPEHIENLSKSKLGKTCKNGFKKGIEVWNKGLTGLKIGTKKGTKFSEEHRKNLSFAFTGRRISDVTREKLRSRKFSNEHRAKLSEKTKAYWTRKRNESK